jgi:predicted histone-like DNA-binding protein
MSYGCYLELLFYFYPIPLFSRVSDKAFPSQRHDRPESATRARRVSDTGKRVPAHFFIHLLTLKTIRIMPFWKKMLNQKQAVYYPRAIVQGKPVETETIAKDLAKISTVSNSDVQAVLGDIAGVMHTRMSQGKSVHIKGLGYFRYVLDTTGVKDLKDFDFEKQVKAVRVEFVPERTRLSSGAYTRALVDSEQLEWIELSATTEDQDPSHGGDSGIEENPLG